MLLRTSGTGRRQPPASPVTTTSVPATSAWWEQRNNIGNFESRFNEGTRRITQHIGVDPARFVWLTDEVGDMLNQSNRNFRAVNGLGDTNWAPMLFLDGHVIYAHITPTIHNTPSYQLRLPIHALMGRAALNP